MIIVNIVIIMQPLRLFYMKKYAQAAFMQYGLALLLIDAVCFVIIFGAGYNALKRIEK
jgi:predicted membrane protein